MIDNQYEDMLRHVLENGKVKGDRTGTGTISAFGDQLRYDLAAGFPLITTKRVSLKNVVAELLWFLRGDSNAKWLEDQGVNIWRSWGDADREMGPIYGPQWRRKNGFNSITPKVFPLASVTDSTESIITRYGHDLGERTVYGVGYYGNYDKQDPFYQALVNVWRDMLKRCYDQTSKAYPAYGGSGVHVSERWQCFANFQQDFRKVPGWELKLEFPDEYQIDKDMRWASNRYDVSTCSWVSAKVQNANRSNTRFFTAVDPDGEEVFWPSIGEMSREATVSPSAVHRCLNGKLKTHHGWSNFQYVDVPAGQVLRYNEVDQVKSVIASLKHDPDSRRHVISMWSPLEQPRMALPPCHGSLIQFYVRGDRLDCMMVQRSADLLLGLPYNIASYALFTHMVAQQTGYKPGELIWTGGDCHIYSNHVEQVREQLSREVRPFPRLVLADRSSIDDYGPEDVEIVGYDPHPAIKAPVAV